MCNKAGFYAARGKLTAMLLLLLLMGGCGLFDPEPIKFMRENIKAYDALSDTLQEVHDAASAQAATAIIESRATRLVESARTVLRMMHKHRNTKVRKDTVDQLRTDLARASTRLQSEMQRINRIRGLPIEFWSVLYSKSIDLVIAGMDIIQASGEMSVNQELMDYMHNSRNLLAQHGYDKLVLIKFSNLPESLSQEAYDKLMAAADGAALYYLHQSDQHVVIIAPVEDYQAFAEKLDFGTIVNQDAPRRLLEIRVDRLKLGAKARSDAAEQRLAQAELLRKRMERDKEREERALRRQEHLAKERGVGHLDQNDPEYFDKLAELLLSGNHMQRREARAVLLRTDPDDVESFKTRKKIARAFKEMALDQHGGSDRGKAIQGLARWGGKFSVPFLLEILDDRHSFVKAEVYRALGGLKDERAAAPVAARLGNFFDHDYARSSLKRMGSVAEDAVLAVAPSPDPKICLAAVEILGEIGTKKSIAFLRTSISRTRNLQVKVAIKAAIKNILKRQRAAEAESK